MNNKIIKKFNDFYVLNEDKSDIDNNYEVFLGGTCNDSKWREELIPMLNCDFFNPVVEDWNEEAQEIEIEKRKTCDLILYVITPKMTGVYSIAEAVDDSNKRPEKTIFCFLTEDEEQQFEEHQIKSLDMTKKMIEENGSYVFDTLKDISDFLNSYEV